MMNIIRPLSLAFCMLLYVLTAFANEKDGYIYTLDLTKVKDDKLFIRLVTPAVNEDEIIFYMPKIIPGTYDIADYGRFVSDFTAYDKKGKKLSVKKIDDNSWKITGAKKLHSITYFVDDSFDYKKKGPEIFEPAGTNIEAGKNFIINTAGFFGYFSGMKDLPFTFSIVRPENFYGGTGLQALGSIQELSSTIQKEIKEPSEKNKVDIYQVGNYDRLIDSPLMYSETDTALIQVGNTEVVISSYSPNKKVSAREIAQTIEETLQAQKNFLGGTLPVDKYAFMFYFTDEPILSYGALEHSYSSMYYMPEKSIDNMRQQLRDFAAHEFFHIITPLTVHSREIHEFDFNDPKMSKHLWLYEGVTEYFAGSVQVRNGLISINDYINMIRKQIITSQNYYNDSLSFTDLSKFTLDKYNDQYANVYQKGALIGMCLDILLIHHSAGEFNLRDLLLELSNKYGKQKPFDDDQLFDEIVAITYPEIGDFFKTYVEGSKPIPYDEFFDLVGITYIPDYSFETLTMGISENNIGLDPKTNKLMIREANTLNEFGKALGLAEGDILLEINDREVPSINDGIELFFQETLQSLEEGKEFSYKVLREEEKGKPAEKRLAATNFMVNYTEKFVIIPKENATETELKNRDAWLH